MSAFSGREITVHNVLLCRYDITRRRSTLL